MTGEMGFPAKRGCTHVVTCDYRGNISISTFYHTQKNALGDALEWLSYRRSKGDNWGKCYTIRERDDKYIFESEFQQRFNL